jgi:putative ABC transport system permease protein
MLKMRIIKNGFRVAWTHKVRALLMVLSVMVGIAALTVIISLGKGTEHKINSQVQKLFSANTIMAVSGGGKMEPNKPVSISGNIKIAEIEEVAQQVSNIETWDAVQRVSGRTAQTNGNSTTVDISGHTPTAETVWNLVLTSGRFFNDAENRSLARVAVLGPNVRQSLFGAADPVGQMMKIDNIPFQVIGVLNERGMDPHGIDKDNEVLIPVNTLMRRVMNQDYVMFAKFLTRDRQQLNATAEQVRRMMREQHSLSINEPDDFMIVTPVKVQEIINRTTRMFNLYLPLLAIVSLLVGGMVIVNLMLISVNERIKEIGLRKAVGAKSSDIAMQFLIEALSITLVSGIVGICIGALIFTYVARIMSIPPVISWSSLFICSAISVFIGILAGYWPAKKAANLTPIESLR